MSALLKRSSGSVSTLLDEFFHWKGKPDLFLHGYDGTVTIYQLWLAVLSPFVKDIMERFHHIEWGGALSMGNILTKDRRKGEEELHLFLPDFNIKTLNIFVEYISGKSLKFSDTEEYENFKSLLELLMIEKRQTTVKTEKEDNSDGLELENRSEAQTPQAEGKIDEGRAGTSLEENEDFEVGKKLKTLIKKKMPRKDDSKCEIRKRDDISWDPIICTVCKDSIKIIEGKMCDNRNRYKEHLLKHHEDRLFDEVPDMDVYTCEYKDCWPFTSKNRSSFIKHLAFTHNEWNKRINKNIQEKPKTKNDSEERKEMQKIKKFFLEDPRVIPVQNINSKNSKPLWIEGTDLMVSSSEEHTDEDITDEPTTAVGEEIILEPASVPESSVKDNIEFDTPLRESEEKSESAVPNSSSSSDTAEEHLACIFCAASIIADRRDYIKHLIEEHHDIQNLFHETKSSSKCKCGKDAESRKDLCLHLALDHGDFDDRIKSHIRLLESSRTIFPPSEEEDEEEEKYKCLRNQFSTDLRIKPTATSIERNEKKGSLNSKEGIEKDESQDETDVDSICISEILPSFALVPASEEKTTESGSKSSNSANNDLNSITSAEDIKSETVENPLAYTVREYESSATQWSCKSCEKSYSDNEDLLRKHIVLEHLQDSFTNLAPEDERIYCCTSCHAFSTSDRTSYILHLAMVHRVLEEEKIYSLMKQSKFPLLDIDVIRCTCGQRFDTEERRRDHIISSHFKQRFQDIKKQRKGYNCECSNSFQQRSHFILHLVKEHDYISQEELGNYIPEKDKQEGENDDKTNNDDDDDLLIGFDDSVSQAYVKLDRLSDSYKFRPKLVCPVCCKSNLSSSNFEDHLGTHDISQEPVFTCLSCNCNMSFANQFYHLSDDHSTAGEVCLQCLCCEKDIHGSDKNEVLERLKHHSTSKKHKEKAQEFMLNPSKTLYLRFRYFCHVCSAFFKSTDELIRHGSHSKAHMKSPREEPIYTCHLCDFSKLASKFKEHCVGNQHRYKVEIEARKFPEKYGLLPEDTIYSCESCKIAMSFTKLIEHLECSKSVCDVVKCGPCDLQQSNDTALLYKHIYSDKHTECVREYIHLPNRQFYLEYRYKCLSCSVAFQYEGRIMSHRKCVKKQFSCLPCLWSGTSDSFTAHLSDVKHRRNLEQYKPTDKETVITISEDDCHDNIAARMKIFPTKSTSNLRCATQVNQDRSTSPTESVIEVPANMPSATTSINNFNSDRKSQNKRQELSSSSWNPVSKKLKRNWPDKQGGAGRRPPEASRYAASVIEVEEEESVVQIKEVVCQEDVPEVLTVRKVATQNNSSKSTVLDKRGGATRQPIKSSSIRTFEVPKLPSQQRRNQNHRYFCTCCKKSYSEAKIKEHVKNLDNCGGHAEIECRACRWKDKSPGLYGKLCTHLISLLHVDRVSGKY